MATGFGRKGAVDDDLAARRAAFIAAERARAERPPEQPQHTAARHAAASRKAPVYAGEKSMATAYLLWFFLGGLSAHRFYLGYNTSAMVQVMLSMGGVFLLIGGALSLSLPSAFLGFAVMVTAGLWVLGDAFMIPGLHERANRNLRQREVGYGFA